MDQTFYALDVILLPEELRGQEIHQIGKLTEISNGETNGVPSNLLYYKRFAEEVGSTLEGKTLLFQFDPRYLFAVNGYEYHQHPKWCYLEALKEAGVNVRTFLDIDYLEGKVLTLKNYDLPNSYSIDDPKLKSGKPLDTVATASEIPVTETSYQLHLDDIGIIFFSKLNTAHEQFLDRGRIFNSCLQNYILNDKALQCFCSEILNPKNPFSSFLPNSLLFSPHTYTETEFHKYMRQVSGDILTLKPADEAFGKGLRFLSRGEVRSLHESMIQQFDPEGYSIFRDSIFTYMDSDVANMVTLLQETIPSKVLIHPKTGKLYAGCARVMVLNGKVLSAEWRAKPYEEGAFGRFNVGKGGGAIVFPPSDEELDLLTDFSQATVKSFQATVQGIEDCFNTEDIPTPYPGMEFESAADWLIQKVYLKRLMVSAMSKGVNIEMM